MRRSRADRDLLDLLELGRSLSALVAGARPLDGSKLQPPHADPRPGIDVDELAGRAARADALVRTALATLDAALAGTVPKPSTTRSPRLGLRAR